MKVSIKTHSLILFILTIVSFFGLIFILYQVKTDFVHRMRNVMKTAKAGIHYPVFFLPPFLP